MRAVGGGALVCLRDLRSPIEAVALLQCGLCDQEESAGGEPPCLADRVCPECGAIVDGGAHRPGCAAKTE